MINLLPLLRHTASAASSAERSVPATAKRSCSARAFRRRRDVARIERAEFGVAGRGFVEPHAVDDLLEVLGVGGPQRDAPFPIFEADARR